MTRKVDTEGDVTAPIVTPGNDGEAVGPLLIEIPLWRLGRIKLESHNAKSSLALFTFLVLVVLAIILAIVEASIGTAPGISSLLEKAGEAMLLVIGFLIGTYGKKSG